MNKLSIAVLVLLVVAVAAGGGYWYGTHQPARSPAVAKAPASANASGQGAAQAMVVEATKVALQPMPQAITAVGSLRSDESVTVRPEVGGRISEILFKEGQHVAKGTTLIRLDASVNAAVVQQAQANLKLAQSKYDRAVELSRQNFISKQAKDEAENNLHVAEAAVSLATARLAKMEIRAPFSRVIGLRVVSVGYYVKEGTDVVNLESIDALKVDFRVPEIYLSQVQTGQTLSISLDALPGKSFEGKVFALNPLLDSAGRSLVIRAVVSNPDRSLRPGMFARVKLITRDERDALVIPEQAIVPQGDEQYVYRIVDGRATRVKVAIGQRRDAKVEVLNGLAPNDVVVTAGQLKLRDGMPVTFVNGPAAASVAGQARKAENGPLPPKS
jgi:membrane fusion protein (multidrug efflux system)